MRMKKNKMLGGGGVDSYLSTSNNNENCKSKFLNNLNSQYNKTNLKRVENKFCVKNDIKINRESRTHYGNSVISKLQTNGKKDFLKLIMWLLVFSIMFILSLQPMFTNKSKISQAGQPNTTTNFADSPVYIAGTNHMSSNTTNAPALFTQSGINTTVLLDLLNMVNSESVWNDYDTSGSNTYLSAYNFGKYTDTARPNSTGYSQIAVKLFDGANLGSITTDVDDQTININEATKQMWQVVYRSMDANNDVLTIYMTQPYASVSYNESYYWAENNVKSGLYQGSNLEDAVVKTWNQINSKYSSLNLSNYVVAPVNVPGQWQTGTSQPSIYSEKNNALTTETQYDLMWVPSSYETYYKNSNEIGKRSSLDNVSSTSTAPAKENWVADCNGDGTPDGRTGLWNLNAYDRAWGDSSIDVSSWLRSGSSGYDWGAEHSDMSGYETMSDVYSNYGVKPALHLNLKSLANYLLNNLSSVTASSSNTNYCQTNLALPYDNWSSNIPTFYSSFNNKVLKSSSEDSGTATITYTFNTDNYEISSLTFNNNETILLSGKEQNTFYTTNNCKFSYQINNGSVVVVVNNITSDLNVVANMVEKGYKITYYAGDGATGNPYTTALINSGTPATILDITNSSFSFTKTGYHFTHWSGNDSNNYDAGATYSGNSNLTLTAQWTINTYTVKFNANAPNGAISTGASSMADLTFTYNEQKALTVNTFAYKYYQFKGWATTTNGGVVYGNNQVVQNLTTTHNGVINLYAVWEKLTCTTTITITLDVPTNFDRHIIFNILNGTKDNYTDVQQIAVSGTTTIKLELEKNTTYTITVSRPYTWGITYGGNGSTINDYYVFTTPNDINMSHTITITGGGIPNISVVI